MPHDFSPGSPTLVLDLSLPGADLDDTDAATVASLADMPAPVALWRSWRSDGERVYLLEVEGDRPGAFPGEVFRTGEPLTPYQRAARARSALLWAAHQTEPIAIARVFDSYDPVLGGQFAVDHPVLSAGDEPSLALSYLDAGTTVLETDGREADVFDEEAGPVVPMNFRTDGRWIWTDAVAYYLRTYALSPDADLLADMRARDFRPPAVDTVALHRALAKLTAGAA